MKINKLITAIFIMFYVSNMACQDIINELKKIESKSHLIIDYLDKDLEFVLKEIATYKGINLLIPQEYQKLNAKITLQLGQKFSIDQAWNLVLEALNIAGYSLKEQQNVFTVIRNPNYSNENLPIYINQDPPNDEIPVKYLYYFKNINISNKQDNFESNNLSTILNNILSVKSNYVLILDSNALLITDKGSVINGAMNVIKNLDKCGFSESMAVFPLKFAIAKDIAKVLNQLIPNERQLPFLKNEKESIKDKCLTEETRITSLDYSNSLVIIGSKKAIAGIKKILITYLDVPLESDRSVISVVKLDYLDAQEFAPVLQNILKGFSPSTQSTSSSKMLGLEHALIIAEGSSERINSHDGKRDIKYKVDGNNLLIAARKQDTKMILGLIEDMDKPEPQVVLECIIASLTQDQINGLGFLDTRSPNNPYDPSLIKWQGNTQGPGGSPILNRITTSTNQIPECKSTLIDSAIGLSADLLAPCKTGAAESGVISNLVSSGQVPGTFLMSFSNGCNGVASLLQIFDQLNITTDFRDPFIVTKNNEKASITSAETRLVQGATQQESTGGPIVINRDQITAQLKLEMKPRIAFDDTVNLDLNVELSNFVKPDASSNNNTIDRRKIITSANLKSGEILVIGGVSQTREEDVIAQSPFGKIPLFGWLFKKQSRKIANKNIYIFISPVIVRKASSIGVYQDVLKNSLDLNAVVEPNTFTGKKILQMKEIFKLEEKNLYGNNLEGLRDPITKIFFKPIFSDSERGGNYISLK